jgi:hypothetical protein
MRTRRDETRRGGRASDADVLIDVWEAWCVSEFGNARFGGGHSSVTARALLTLQERNVRQVVVCCLDDLAMLTE